MSASTVTVKIPENIKVKLSKMTLDQVLKEVEKAASLELAKDIQVNWNELKNQAQLFLSSVNTLDQEYANTTAALLKQVVANPEIASYANESQKKKEAYYTQSLYMLAASFEDYLSRFREEDKERRMLYVFTNKDGSIVETYEMSLRELILNSDKYGRWADISKKRLTNNGRMSAESNNDGFFDGNHVKTAQKAYEGTFQRLSRYFEVHKTSQKQNGLVLWREQRQWMVGNVVNTGDLKEAYVSFLFSEHTKNDLCSLNAGDKPYYSHDLIGNFYKQYVTKVTNLEAIIEEDVLTTNKQYGVKGRKASLPSFQQYVDVAVIIMSQTGKGLNKNELEKEIDLHFKRGDETKGARNIYSTIEEAIDAGKAIKEELDKVKKKVT